MANLFREQRLVDNNKRSLIKYVWISDGTLTSNATMVDVSTLSNALNTNGYIMTANTDPKTAYRVTVKRIFGQAKIGGYMKMQWQGATNTEIAVISSGGFDINFETSGDGAVISTTETANNNGDIVFSTAGQTANDSFTLFLELKKEPKDYDPGRWSDPAAFNR